MNRAILLAILVAAGLAAPGAADTTAGGTTPMPPMPPPPSGALAAARAAMAMADAGVQVALPTRTPLIGDQVALTLSIDVPADCDLDGAPRFPSWGERWGEAEVVRADPPGRPEAGGATGQPAAVHAIAQTLVVAAYRTGAVALPPVEVVLPCRSGSRSLRTAEGLALTVQALLPAEGAKPDPKPAAPPRRLALPLAFWWATGTLSALCLGAIVLLVRQRRRLAPLASGDRTAPTLPPLAELAARLAALRAEADDASPDRLHTALSFAVRRYLGRQLSFHAIESSTSEIARLLARRELPSALVRTLVRLLRDCDGVKFAKVRVEPASGIARLDQALAAAGELDAHLHPAAVVPPVAASGTSERAR